MRFFQSIITGAALVAAALAVEINTFPSEVEVGKSYTVTYSPNDDAPTTFLLRQGLNEDLKTLATLTTSATGGSFTWNVDSTLPNGDDYALEIKQGDTNNYIGPIKVTGSSYSASPIVSSASSSAVESSSVISSAEYTTTVSATPTSAEYSASSVESLSSVVTSAPALSLVTSAYPSASVSFSASVNGTFSSATLSGKPTGSATGSAGIPESTGAASALGSSPLALIFGAVAAMAYLN